MQYSLDHIHVRCSDAGAGIAYFKKMFDAKEIGTGGTKAMPITFLEMAGQRFAFSPKHEEVTVRAQPGEPGWGLYQIGLKVENLDASMAELKERGAEISAGPLTVRDGLRVFFVRGPDGIEIEVMEYS